MSRQLALQLDARRREIEEELGALMSVLQSHNATLTSPLVDAEGFPRADIDIHAIRIARNRIAHLRNDRVDLTEQMAEAMRQAFHEPPGGGEVSALPNGHSTSSRDDQSSIAASSTSSSSASQPAQALKPFARVNSVADGSPAALAGLRADDVVLSFAGLSTPSSDDDSPPPSLAALPPLVREGQAIEIIVQRAQRGGASEGTPEVLSLQLTPQSGSGHRGLLGCHLLPI